jgi:hypothetical protein
MGHAAIVTLLMLLGAAARAADEEPACTSLLRQIGFAAQRFGIANDDKFEKAKYLEKIALMSRSALQSAYPSSAWVFESELARASQRLDAAETRSQLALGAMDLATAAYVQQCPQHFTAIHGDYVQLAMLVVKAMSDSTQEEPSK